MRSSLFDAQGEVSLLLPDGRAGYCNFKQVKALREGGMVGVFPGASLYSGLIVALAWFGSNGYLRRHVAFRQMLPLVR